MTVTFCDNCGRDSREQIEVRSCRFAVDVDKCIAWADLCGDCFKKVADIMKIGPAEIGELYRSLRNQEAK